MSTRARTEFLVSQIRVASIGSSFKSVSGCFEFHFHWSTDAHTAAATGSTETRTHACVSAQNLILALSPLSPTLSLSPSLSISLSLSLSLSLLFLSLSISVSLYLSLSISLSSFLTRSLSLRLHRCVSLCVSPLVSVPFATVRNAETAFFEIWHVGILLASADYYLCRCFFDGISCASNSRPLSTRSYACQRMWFNAANSFPVLSALGGLARSRRRALYQSARVLIGWNLKAAFFDPPTRTTVN